MNRFLKLPPKGALCRNTLRGSTRCGGVAEAVGCRMKCFSTCSVTITQVRVTDGAELSSRFGGWGGRWEGVCGAADRRRQRRTTGSFCYIKLPISSYHFFGRSAPRLLLITASNETASAAKHVQIYCFHIRRRAAEGFDRHHLRIQKSWLGIRPVGSQVIKVKVDITERAVAIVSFLNMYY